MTEAAAASAPPYSVDANRHRAAGVMRVRPLVAPVLALSLLLPSTAGCLGCPVALLTGTLADQAGELVVVHPDGPPTHVQWPFGYGSREIEGRLALVDLFGTVQAAEGDEVRIGGAAGQAADSWVACGEIESDPAPTPQEA